ncbi:MAG: hypothetical protein ABTR07_00375 [Candidatus Competibacter denitrificans]
MANQTVRARAAQNLAGMIFEGDTILRVKLDDGTLGKPIGPISPLKLAINPGDATIKTRELHLRGMAGQRADPVTIESAEPTFAMETDDAGGELLLLALRASESALAEGGGSVTDEVVPVKFKDSWLQLPHRNIVLAGFVGKHANDSALVAETDYGLQDIWLQHGMIFIPGDSTIAVDEACKWSYAYKAVSGKTLLGNQVAQVTMQVELFGTNRVNKKPVKVTIFECTVNKATEIDFAANDYIKPNFSGVMTTPVGKSAPYQIEELAFAP